MARAAIGEAVLLGEKPQLSFSGRRTFRDHRSRLYGSKAKLLT